MDIQTEVQKIHHQFGVSEKANYEIQKLFDKAIKEAVTEALRIHDVVGRSEQLVCDCGDSSMTWYGNDDDKKWFCFNCKKEAN
jgi:hypothetical protein